MRKIITIIGDGKIEKDSLKYKLAYEMGKSLIDNGYRVQTGGLGGVMSAALEGAKSSKNYKEGDTIAMVPSFDTNQANEYADIVVATGLDLLRNVVGVNTDAVIAIGGGAGTLSEMAMAWAMYKLIVSFENVDGWSSKLANQKIDQKIRYENLKDDKVYGVNSVEEAIKIINDKINIYTKKHLGITFRK